MGVMTHKVAIYGWVYTKSEFESLFGTGTIPHDYEDGAAEIERIQEWFRSEYPILQDPFNPALHHPISVGYVSQYGGYDGTNDWTIVVSLFGAIPGDDQLYKENGYTADDLTAMHAQFTAHKNHYIELGAPKLHFLLNVV